MPDQLRFTVAQVAMLAGLVSLTFFFGGLILAFGLRMDANPLWTRFEIPGLLWAGTAVLVLSSASLELARYHLRRGHVRLYRTLNTATVALAGLFLALQVGSAVQLLSQGVAAEANPHGSAFYVFMGIHGAHLAAGITWLLVLWTRSRKLFSGTEQALRQHRRAIGAAAIFWHFMGVLWLVLFYFLRRWTVG